MALGQQHVVRLDVTMHDAVAMRVRRCVDDVAQNAHRVRNWQRTIAFDLCSQRLAGDVRHDVVEQSRRRTSRQKLDDVRVLHPCGELNLASESVDLHADGQFRRKDLDHDPATKLHFFGQEHAAHAAATQLGLDSIG